MTNPTLDLLQIGRFGVQGMPSEASPNVHAFYNGPTYKDAVSTLVAGICRRIGLMVLTGKAGTGKTLVIHRVIDHLDDSPIQPVLFDNPHFTFDEFIAFACKELGLNEPGGWELNQGFQDKLEVLQKYLTTQAQEGRSVAFFIDNAQDATEDVLANLLKLSGPQTAGRYLLQIVLIGRPELETVLRRTRLRELIPDSLPPYRLLPLKPEEVGDFIYQQLSAVSGWRDDLFSPEALASIALYSRGIPHLINVLCDFALLTASINRREKITADIVEKAAAELCSSILAKDTEPLHGPQGDLSTVHINSALLKQEKRARQESLAAPAEAAPANPTVHLLPEERPMLQAEDPSKERIYSLETLNKIDPTLTRSRLTMDLQDTAKQYRLVGETVPWWVIFSLTVLGILGCIATAWLINTELDLKVTAPWPAEVGQADSKAVPADRPSGVTRPPQPPEESAAKAGQDNTQTAPPAYTGTVTEPLQPPADSPAKGQTEVTRVQPSISAVPNCPPLFTFTFASESVSPQGPPNLGEKVIQLRDWLNAHPQARLLIEGHSDTWGDKQFNLQLSSQRAKAVAVLLAEAGVPQKQLVTRALGAERPLQDKRSGSQKNRRVSLRIENAQGCPETSTEDNSR